ncbi:hypothetical protein N3K66_006242 [Trichothecium roseum]|uniref:Uncharacterized protein n=1 Tax=Trichothecium roseum TaxID=47278 RepID=A0ACC0V089_9HYPO|nr:hypothetical protein N3K66_006242 [Trichothecium roseum]
MVKISLVMGLAALAPFSMAQPIDQDQNQGVASGFSFEAWVNDIIANPEGDHLSPEEAVAAALEDGTVSSSASSSHEKRLGPNDVVCNRNGFTSAKAPDAVSCINELARRGSQACRAKSATKFCSIGTAEIVGVAGEGPKYDTSAPCQQVASAAGRILDICWRADNTVQGMNYVNGNAGLMALHVSHP